MIGTIIMVKKYMAEENTNGSAKSKKKSGFFDFIFNTAKFVDDISDNATTESIKLPEEQTANKIQVNEPVAIASPQTEPVHLNGKFSVDLALHLSSVEELKNYIERYDHYHMLGLDNQCDEAAIRAGYLRLTRMLLSCEIPSEQKWKQHQCSQALSLANQVLSDPLTRSQYDPTFKMPAEYSESNSSKNSGGVGNFEIAEIIRVNKMLGRQTSKIIEELKALGLQSEEEFCDEVKRRGLLSEGHIESLLLVKHLMAAGKIKQTQLELISDELNDSESPLWITLVAKGWITPADADIP